MTAEPARWVHLDGVLVPRDQASISVLDRGLLYGDSVFETIRVTQGTPLFLDEHLARLTRSAELLELDLPLPPAAFAAAVRETVEANRVGDAACRLMITRGQGPLGLSTRGVTDPTVIILVEPTPPMPERYAKGIHVIVSRHHRPPVAEGDVVAKTGNYLAGILAKREAESRGADDALHVDANGHVTEATTANVFIVAGDTVATPTLAGGALEGLTRGRVLTLARKEGFAVAERVLDTADIARASEVFLTSTVAGVVPVTQFEGAAVGTGVPGPITLRLHALERSHALDRHGLGNNSP